jgi:hypothetical protein
METFKTVDALERAKQLEAQNKQLEALLIQQREQMFVIKNQNVILEKENLELKFTLYGVKCITLIMWGYVIWRNFMS